MSSIPNPIFKNKLPKISWKKIYAREYGVQYSEMAIWCLSDKAKHHIPQPSFYQIVIPEDNNTAFYIDETSWIKLEESLNLQYTSSIKQLEDYERQFTYDGENYLKTAKKIAKLNLKKLSNKKLKNIYLDYQKKLFLYSVFIWTAFILNNYIAERASVILNNYIRKYHKDDQKELFFDSLFKPIKKSAILKLQEKIAKYNGKLSENLLENLYENFKWLSCLDIHNKPWTKKEFREHIKSFTKSQSKNTVKLAKIIEELKIKSEDSKYLSMTQRFVYIKDARDDYRRQGVYQASIFFKELARRMDINPEDVSYLQESEVLAFFNGGIKITKDLISERKKGFILYLDENKNMVCLTGNNLIKTLKAFNLLITEKKTIKLTGTVASRGMATGKVAIVQGVKDLNKVKKGNILVAVTTHPDYVPAMRKAAAIVTNEGGITSHAAIVSREFGIPCIVGTKHATTTLKDEEIVEVNAIEGWVKKL